MSVGIGPFGEIVDVHAGIVAHIVDVVGDDCPQEGQGIVRVEVLVVEVGEQDAVDEAYGGQFLEPHHGSESHRQLLVAFDDGRVGSIVLDGMHDVVEFGNVFCIIVAAVDELRYEAEEFVLVVLVDQGVHRIVDERHDVEVVAPLACQFHQHVEVAVVERCHDQGIAHGPQEDNIHGPMAESLMEMAGLQGRVSGYESPSYDILQKALVDELHIQLAAVLSLSFHLFQHGSLRLVQQFRVCDAHPILAEHQGGQLVQLRMAVIESLPDIVNQQTVLGLSVEIGIEDGRTKQVEQTALAVAGIGVADILIQLVIEGYGGVIMRLV